MNKSVKKDPYWNHLIRSFTNQPFTSIKIEVGNPSQIVEKPIKTPLIKRPLWVFN